MYEGNFYNGMMHGYGVFIERNNPLKDKNLEKLAELMGKNILANDSGDEKKVKENNENLDEKQIEESFYEGEFCYGYRHGLGRYYFKKGSYLYGEWRFDKSIGNSKILAFIKNFLVFLALYYFADENKWQLTFFDITEKETLLKSGEGLPPIKLDGYKSMIDECGIKNEKLEDYFFPNNIETLGIKIPQVGDFNYFRISEIFKQEKYELFSEVFLYLIDNKECN